MCILTAILDRAPLPRGAYRPEPWPTTVCDAQGDLLTFTTQAQAA
jgi:hypothetical protein